MLTNFSTDVFVHVIRERQKKKKSCTCEGFSQQERLVDSSTSVSTRSMLQTTNTREHIVTRVGADQQAQSWGGGRRGCVVLLVCHVVHLLV